MSEVTIKLTREEYERVVNVLAYNIDVNIQPELNAAMEKKQESRVRQLMQLKTSDTAILDKFREADRYEPKQAAVQSNGSPLDNI